MEIEDYIANLLINFNHACRILRKIETPNPLYWSKCVRMFYEIVR